MEELIPIPPRNIYVAWKLHKNSNTNILMSHELDGYHQTFVSNTEKFQFRSKGKKKLDMTSLLIADSGSNTLNYENLPRYLFLWVSTA
jgi:hypothetical protein